MQKISDGFYPRRNWETSEPLTTLPEASYRALTDEMPQMVWSTLSDGYHDYFNRRWYEFTGVPVGSTDGDGWNGMFHPDDQEKSWNIWQACLESGEPYEVEYRLRHHSGEYRWTLGRAMPIHDEDGNIVRWIGTCTDIHEHKKLIETNELLNQELSHRIKNIFAVISALIGLSSDGKPEVEAFSKSLRERIAALGNAHEFVRPHSEKSRLPTASPTLFGMLDKIFMAYPAYREGRLVLAGDDIPVDDQAATPLALIFHELATNALKYGALKDSNGRVAIESRREEADVLVSWQEHKDDTQIQPPTREGFGSQLIAMSAEQQMGGSIKREWLEHGLKVTMTFPAGRLSR